jgi:hypothetical protein
MAKKSNTNHYVDTTLSRRPWQPQDVIAIELEKDGSIIRFDAVKTEMGDYRQFVSADGWRIRELENGPIGVPFRFSLGRLIWNLLFNFGHLLGWFLGLWLLLRFQWSHALGLAIVLWVVMMLVVLPMMLNYSGLIAARSHATAWLTLWMPLS